MREILFRGKRIDNGELVQGSLSMEYFSECGCVMISPTSDICYKVIPETVGQFIGLTDKNSKKIFEGDIVTVDVIQNTGFKVLKYTETYVVTYHPKYCYFYLKREKNNLLFDGNWSYGVFVQKVIGNIYDNPELLEVER